MIDHKILDEIIESLVGTCNDLDQTMVNHNIDPDAMDMGDSVYMDDHIFLCEECGWWFDLSELNDSGDGLICLECRPEKNDE
jgi:hypothetical protein